jgi:hypothetical protein
MSNKQIKRSQVWWRTQDVEARQWQVQGQYRVRPGLQKKKKPRRLTCLRYTVPCHILICMELSQGNLLVLLMYNK